MTPDPLDHSAAADGEEARALREWLDALDMFTRIDPRVAADAQPSSWLESAGHTGAAPRSLSAMPVRSVCGQWARDGLYTLWLLWQGQWLVWETTETRTPIYFTLMELWQNSEILTGKILQRPHETTNGLVLFEERREDYP